MIVARIRCLDLTIGTFIYIRMNAYFLFLFEFYEELIELYHSKLSKMETNYYEKVC